MTISSRGWRGMVYVYAATDQLGYVTQRYTLQGTYFCRISVASAEERTVARQAEHHEGVVIEFADAVAVGLNDIVVVDNVQYRVESSIVRRLQRSRVVRAFRVDDDVFLKLLLCDGTATANGTYQASGYVDALAAA